MDCKWFWVLLVMMLVSLGKGCWEEERTALLQLKHFFTDPFGNLYNWVENSECCRWEMVECDNITGKVIKLDLFFTRDEILGEWYLNASLFSPFQQLQSLNLSGNNIAGCIENKGFERLSRLSYLEELNLGGNNFNNSILSSLASISSLKHLDLSYNRFKGVVNIEGLYSLKNLKELDMSGNEIDQFVNFKGLSNLEIMDLSYNNFNNSILSSLGGLSLLKSLYLEDIGLNGTIDIQGLQSLKKLEELHMGCNRIDKFVNSKDYRGLKKLNVLSLSSIETTNASVVLQSMLRSFPFLKTLDLSSIDFNEIVIPRELHNLTTLEELILDGSKLDISFLQTVATSTSLKHLLMSGCELNGISQVQGPINFKNLESLFMNGTTFNNSFRQIIRPIATLKKLSLQNCGLNGTLHDQG
ncbi:hypothetical protein Patl1_14638 [Pistacia atlantica]|uniref:Uncharacterized protein n=1 Tax=Pistacia atlantica TaxID=434234 RepID=A0ACC1AX89_9ROSI|nr:hypothetical protein Patl1_14638 [Pistacia atlantica]